MSSGEKKTLTSQADAKNGLEEGLVKITFTTSKEQKGKVTNLVVNEVSQESCQWDLFECRKSSQGAALSTMMILSHMMDSLLDGLQKIKFRDHKIGPQYITLRLEFRGDLVGKLALKEDPPGGGKISLMSYQMKPIREHLKTTKEKYGEEPGWILLNELTSHLHDKHFGAAIAAERFVTAFDGGQNDWVFRRYLGKLTTNSMDHVLATTEKSHTKAVQKTASEGGWDCSPMPMRFLEALEGGGSLDLKKFSSTVSLKSEDTSSSFLQKYRQQFDSFKSSKSCDAFLQSELALYAPRRELWLNHAFESAKNVMEDAVCVTSGDPECKLGGQTGR